jgi:hypothetical protein
MTTEEPPTAQTAYLRIARTTFRRSETLHQEVERIAVPNFDWIAAPIDGYAAAFSALGHAHLHFHLRRTHGAPQPEPPG